MNRRDFAKHSLLTGMGAVAGSHVSTVVQAGTPKSGIYTEPQKQLPIRHFDVIVAGGGTAGVVAALAAARQGVKTVLIEAKGYPGGTVTEGGTALHSYYNLWKAFPGVEKRQVVRGIAQEIIDRLMEHGGTSGHAEMFRGYDYDSVCTAIDTELYKLVTFKMLDKAGVHVCVNTLLTDAVVEDSIVKGVIAESVSGREYFAGKTFIDCTAIGDLSAAAGADFSEPNDYPVCNSIGIANVDIDKYFVFLDSHDSVTQLARGIRDDQDNRVVRVQGNLGKLPDEFGLQARKIGMSSVTTTVHNNYLMFIKVNFKMDKSPTDRDAVAKAELEIRQRQLKALELFKKFVPGCENALIARTSPHLNIRRGRLIKCDYDISISDVVEGRHFEDDVFVYGFHDSAPRIQIKDGKTYGFPYRALCVSGLDNLFASGMLITSDHDAHMSTRNTVCCMGQGQASGTAAALCVQNNCSTRELEYAKLRKTLERDGVYFES